ASEVVLSTAHRRAGGGQPGGPTAEPTRVYYMGVERLSDLCAQLIEQGLDRETPCALVENGSRTNQRVIHASLEHIVSQSRHHTVRSPALFIVGAVAALGPRLAWFGETLAPDDGLEAVRPLEASAPLVALEAVA
ncbi:MAG TPA: SAM-dependent methyltransferase, partial [Castellaniella sp.]|nr:SAM-dependent methyltransferase [Castellaniella sp.]